MSEITHSWWPLKYRPSTIDEYVGNDAFITKVKGWINSGEINHLLLHSTVGGTGKTSAAWLIAKSIDADVLYINASKDNGIDIIRDKILPFASNMGFKSWKVVILDEAEGLTQNFQLALKATIEDYSITTRFILTTNNVDAILQPIRSRCSEFEINSPPRAKIAKRLQQILHNENISYDIKDIVNVVNDFYPDQRSMINYLQDNSIDGKFTYIGTVNNNEYGSMIVDLLISIKSAKDIFVEIRQLVADHKIKRFESIYKYLYDNIDTFANKSVGAVILAIADGQYKDVHVVDKEINFMAVIVNIINIIKG